MASAPLAKPRIGAYRNALRCRLIEHRAKSSGGNSTGTIPPSGWLSPSPPTPPIARGRPHISAALRRPRGRCLASVFAEGSGSTAGGGRPRRRRVTFGGNGFRHAGRRGRQPMDDRSAPSTGFAGRRSLRCRRRGRAPSRAGLRVRWQRGRVGLAVARRARGFSPPANCYGPSVVFASY